MTDTTNQALKPDNHLADLWRKEFIDGLTERRDALVVSAKGCQEGGWYRGQLEQQIALYDCALSASAASRAPAAQEVTDEQLAKELASRIDCWNEIENEDRGDIFDAVKSLLALAAAPAQEAAQPAPMAVAPNPIQVLRKAMDDAGIQGENRARLVGHFANNWNAAISPTRVKLAQAVAVTDEQISVLIEQANLATDSYCDGLSHEPTKAESDAYFYHCLLQHTAAPKVPDGWQAVFLPDGWSTMFESMVCWARKAAPEVEKERIDLFYRDVCTRPLAAAPSSPSAPQAEGKGDDK